MRSEQITFVLFAFNEEARIERAIRNFVHAGRVLVVDNYSTDRTEELSLAAGATILKHNNPGWVENENTVAIVKAAVETPWIYWGFTDEMVDRSTLEAVIAGVEDERYSIVSIVRKNYYYGNFCGDAYAHVMNRAFRKDAIDFTGNKIHHFGRVTVEPSSILQLDTKRYFVHHFISHTAKVYLRSLDMYSDIEPKGATSASVAQMLFEMCKTFIGNYWLRGGYRAGLPGFFVVVQQAYYNALLHMKTFEEVNALTYDTIEVKNNMVRDQLLTGDVGNR